MIARTNSFERLKSEQQKILDFAVLICHAIPNVKKTIKGNEAKVEHFSIPNPDYFNLVHQDNLKELSKHYKVNLSKYLIISSFSFFEAYFKSVLEELIDFQGGTDKFIETISDRHKTIIAQNNNEELKKHKRKLQEPFKKKNIKKYELHSNKLMRSTEFKMPSELFSTLGIKYLFELVSSDRFRSVMIPELLEKGLLLDLGEKINKSSSLREKTLKETFDSMRDLRNRISHGDNPNIDFSKAMDYIRFLRFLSVKIDKHLIENFFILENLNR